MDANRMAVIVLKVSAKEYCLTADKIPRDIPTMEETRKERQPSFSVTGTLVKNSPVKGCLVR